MKKLLASLLIALSGAASADDMVYRYEKDSVRLQLGACSPKVLAHIGAEHHDKFKSAAVIFEGRNYAACWTLHTPSVVYVQYEDGDATLIPVAKFSREPGV